MFRLYRPLFLVLFVGLLIGFVGSGSVLAKPRDGHGKARVTWSQQRVTEVVQPGQVVQVKVSFTSSADLQQVLLRTSGGLSNIVKVEPSTIASIKAGVTQNVTLTIMMPSEGAASQGGVVQVRAGERNVPHSLKVKVSVPGSDDDAEQNDQKPEKDRKRK